MQAFGLNPSAADLPKTAASGLGLYGPRPDPSSIPRLSRNSAHNGRPSSPCRADSRITLASVVGLVPFLIARALSSFSV
jgi:hypothetical protein